MTGAATRVVDIADHAGTPMGFRRIAAAARSPAPAPGFLFGGFGAAAARALYGQIETPEVGVYELADARVAPTGIALRDGAAFCGMRLNLPRAHVEAVVGRLDTLALPVRHVAGTLVPLFGPAEESAAHLVADYLPRLWLLEQAGCALETLHFLVPAVLPPRVEAVLACLGLPRIVRYAHWAEVIATDLLLLPTVLRWHDRLSPGFAAASRFWTARVGVLPGADCRLFISGEDGPPNARLAERIAAAQGFRIVEAGALDLAKRAALFAAATHIVGAEGAAMYDMVFARAGTRVCLLRDARREAGFLLGGVGAGLGLAVGYVFWEGEMDEADYRRGLEILLVQ